LSTSYRETDIRVLIKTKTSARATNLDPTVSIWAVS